MEKFIKIFAIVAAAGCLSFFAKYQLSAVFSAINYLPIYQQQGTKNVGEDCEYALKKDYPYDADLAEFKFNENDWRSITIPYGPVPLDRFILNSVLVVRCVVDLSDLEPGEYAEINFGAIFGESLIYVNKALRFQSTKEARAIVPLGRSDLLRDTELLIVSHVTKNQVWPGLSGYMPAIAIQGYDLSKSIGSTYESWTGEVHIIRFGVISVLIGIIFVCYLMGLRYNDVAAALLFGSYYALFAWFCYSSPPAWLINRAKFMVVISAGFPAMFFLFAATFFRKDYGLGKIGYLTLMLIGFFMALSTIDEGTISNYIGGFRIARMLGSLIFLWAAVEGISLARKTSGVRRTELQVFCALSIAAFLLSVATIVNYILYSAQAFEYTDFYIVLGSLCFFLIDLGVFHQRYLRETIKARDLGEMALRNEAIVNAVLMLSHDLKRPFFVLKAFVARLKLVQTKADVGAVCDTYLPAVDRANDQALSIISSISQIQAANILNKSHASLSNMIAHLVEVPVYGAESKNITLDVVLEHLYLCDVDHDKIFRALSNIYENAVHATSANGIVRIRSSVDRTRSRLLVEVFNSDSYIPEEMRSRIFELFFTTKGTGGTGLGLGITKRLIEAHGGKIEVRSAQGVGTTFILSIPGCLVSRSADRSVIFTREIHVNAFRPHPVYVKNQDDARIVIVDDDPFTVDEWRKKFATYSCRCFTSPNAALAFLRGLTEKQKSALMLIISDFHFQDEDRMNGLEFAKAIPTEIQVPVLIVSHLPPFEEPGIPEFVKIMHKDEFITMEVAEIIQRAG